MKRDIWEIYKLARDRPPGKLIMFLIVLFCMFYAMPLKLAEWIDRKRASDDEKNTPSRVFDEESLPAERPADKEAEK